MSKKEADLLKQINALEEKQAKFNEQIDKEVQRLSTEWLFSDRKRAGI